MVRRPRLFHLESMESRRLMAVDIGQVPTADLIEAHISAADLHTGGWENLDSGTLDPGGPPATSIPITQELPLHSLPGAAASIFLDFNGHFQDAPFLSFDDVTTPAFDRDGNPLTFSPSEQQFIRFIWASVAEDYAPFNIDVTTVDPDPGLADQDGHYLRVVISGDEDFRGTGKAGFAEVGGFARDSVNIVYVFNQDGNGSLISVSHIAKVSAHEAGHSFGLEHNEPGTGDDFRAPIMRQGVISAERAVWWDGQADLIAGSRNGFGYRPDQHANTIAGAGSLIASSAGLFGSGVIEATSDTDTFRFETGGGNIHVQVILPTATQQIGVNPTFVNVGNLDASLRLTDSQGNVLAQDSNPSLLASLSAAVPAGTYFVQVGSFGLSGDIGKYSLLVNETTGPYVQNAGYVSVETSHAVIRVNFDEPVHPLTFTSLDVRVNGGGNGVGVLGVSPETPTNWRSYLVTIDNPTATTVIGSVNLSIGPDIRDPSGNPMDQNRNGVSGETTDQFTVRLLRLADGIFEGATWTFDINPIDSTWDTVIGGTRFAQSDINRDGSVDAGDAGLLFASWGRNRTLQRNLVLAGDINGDSIVDAADAGLMFSQWTRSRDVPPRRTVGSLDGQSAHDAALLQYLDSVA